jgi:hypothetical protein
VAAVTVGVSAVAMTPRGNPAALTASVWTTVVLMVLTGLLWFAARAFLLPGFLRELARSLKDYLTASRCETFMKLMLAVAGIYVAVVLLAPVLTGPLALILLPVALTLLVMGVIALVLYLMICSALRGDIADHRGSRPRRRSRAARR